MSAKDLTYWREAWNRAKFFEDYQNADYVLKHYARQPFNSYRQEIAKFYFGTSSCLSIFVPTINIENLRTSVERRNMDSVIKDLQGILNRRPIYKDSDLHNILLIFGEMTKKDYTQSFNIIKRPSFFENFVFLEYFISFLQKCFGKDQIEEETNYCSPKQ